MPLFMGAAHSAGGWRDSICLHGFAEAVFGKEFLIQSARAYARARA